MKRKLKLMDVEEVKFVPGVVIDLPKKVKSYAVEVIADNSGTWAGNAMRYSTKEKAIEAAKSLAWRWTLVRDWRVVESSDPVNEH